MTLIETSKNRPGKAIVEIKGGPCSVANEALFAAVREFKNKGYEVVVPRSGTDGILGIDYKDKDGKVLYTDPPYLNPVSSFSDEKIEQLRKEPGIYDGTSKTNINDQNAPRIIEQYKKFDIHYQVLIGGNSTAGIAQMLIKAAKAASYELHIGQVIKTLDNDTMKGDFAIGYPSAMVHEAKRAIELEADNRSAGGIYVILCMGRDSGFLPLAYGLPFEGLYDIYTPEMHHRMEHMIYNIEIGLGKRGRAMLAVSEGLSYDYDLSGNRLPKPLRVSQEYCDRNKLPYKKEQNHHDEIDPNDNTKYLIQYLDYELSKAFPNMRIRIFAPDYAVRGSKTKSNLDAFIAGKLGIDVVMNLLVGKSGFAIGVERESNGLLRLRPEIYDIDDIAKFVRPVPEAFIGKYGGILSEVGQRYMAPLAGTKPGFNNQFCLPPDFDLEQVYAPLRE